MPQFIIRVGTPDGQIVERHVDASTSRAAEEELRQQGLHVFAAKRGTISLRDFLPRSRKVVSMERFLLFNQELLALVRAGLPILQSFDIMLERQKDARFREVLADIREKLKSGVSLSDAFASFGNIFPPIYSTSLRAGERSGDLEGVLRRFLKYQKMIVALRKKVITALIYPTVLITMMIGMVFVMLTKVIPKFAEFYRGFDAQLPAFTRLMITISYVLTNNLLVTFVVAAIVIILIRQWVATTGRLTW